MNSRIPGFYKLSLEERVSKIRELTGVDSIEELLGGVKPVDISVLETLSENVVGSMEMPFSIAVNFRINGRDMLIPMVIEESSVVAAASNAAKYMREGDGIVSVATESLVAGQIQVINLPNPHYSGALIHNYRDRILDIANRESRTLTKLGGGAKDIETRVINTRYGEMLVIHLIVDTVDAMGANVVNRMCEAVAPYIEEITGGKALLRILSNNMDRRLVRASVKISRELLDEGVPEAIAYASAFAEADPYRAVTHNKGIMNGVIAVALATCQDHRAIEAAAHAYAARGGRYTSLSHWEVDREGNLTGSLEMPIPVGVVGGATKVHPKARLALEIMGVSRARELAEVMGAVGLAQNFAALKALATEGIIRGHMELHARNIAIMAGASGDEVDEVADKMIREGRVSYSRAMEILDELRRGK